MSELVNTDADIAALAARQYGVVAVRQVALSKDAIASRRRTGRWHPIHRGVYGVGHRPTGREARWLAAVLACGDGAVLSHRSAATLWRIRDGEGPRPDVTAAVLRRYSGIATHRAALLAGDCEERFGIPVTSPSRTLADLAHALPLDDLVRAFRETQFRRLYDRAALIETLKRRPSKHLNELMEDAAVTQSRLEDDFKALCDRYGIERPRTQYRMGARTYDFVWPEHRLVVETDSWQAHGTPFAFQNDRSVSNVLQLEGWTILRFTSKDVTRRRRHVAATVRAALSRSAARSASSAPAPRRPRPPRARAAS